MQGLNNLKWIGDIHGAGAPMRAELTAGELDYRFILNTIKELGYDGEEVLFLKHMVIAHHGKLEWGSPKEPMIIEAELLHYHFPEGSTAG